MTTQAYRDVLRSARWRMLKERRLRVAGYACEGPCGRSYAGKRARLARRYFDLHHVNYDRVGREELGDVRILCRSCHSLHHGKLG